MTRAESNLVAAFFKGRFSFLLVGLTLMLLVGPLFPGDQSSVDDALGALNLLVLFSCLRAISRSRIFFWSMVVFTLALAGASGAELARASNVRGFVAIVLAGNLIFYVIVWSEIMRYVLDASAVTSEKIHGALCAYLLMGLGWAYVYALFLLADPTCLKIPPELLSADLISGSWALYFSFTTLTTMGYGDITPLTPAAQSYAVAQAVMGQLFIAVIMARLIALRLAGEEAAARKTLK